MNRTLAIDRLSGLSAVLAGLWILRHFGSGFWGCSPVILNTIQAIADRIEGIHRKAAFKVFALWLAIGLSVLSLALLLLGLLMAAIGASQGRSRQPTGPAIASQKETVDIEVQYENSFMWEPRDSCSNYEQEISLELRRILERPGIHRARAIGRVSRRVYDALQK